MKTLILFLVLAYCQANYATRQERVISLFNIIKFKNAPCSSNSPLSSSGTGASFRNGTCVTTEECSEKGGVASGGCAQGFGTCCVFMISDCGGVVRENCSYIRNPNFPESVTDLTSCKFTIQKCDTGVCSLRLDFESFNILGPALTTEVGGGTCVDSFTAMASATGSKTPVICGENAGQHVYIDIGQGEMNQAAIEFTFDQAQTTGRQFEIKITQIFCNSNNRPPDGCLQWLTGTEGRLMTFNFASSTGHLAEQKYNVCLRQEKGFCCVKYQVCDDPSSFSFDIIKDMAADFVSAEDELCLKDFVTIEASTSNCGLIDTSNRYCGHFLADVKESKGNLEICDCTAPFEVGITSDNMPDLQSAMVLSRGVCLNYVQTACGMSVP